MSMKKIDVKDVTIRTVGDVGSISTSDTAKSGVNSPDLGIGSPKSMGNPSGAPTGPTPMTIPSVNGLPVGPGDDNSALNDPDMGAASDASSLQTSKAGQSVSFPAAADTTSAGGAKSIGSGGTLVMKTGSAVKFPSASNTSAPVKSVESFG